MSSKVPPQYCDTLNRLDAARRVPNEGYFPSDRSRIADSHGERGGGEKSLAGERSELRQMKSQLGQRVAGTARRIPSTSPKRTASRGSALCGTARREGSAARRGILPRRRLSSLPTPFGETRRPPPQRSLAHYAAALRHRTV